MLYYFKFIRLYLLWNKTKFHNFVGWKKIILIVILKKKIWKEKWNK